MRQDDNSVENIKTIQYVTPPDSTYSPPSIGDEGKALTYSIIAVWFSGILIYLLTFISFYGTEHDTTRPVSLGIIGLYSIATLILCKTFKYPLSKLGVTLENWRPAVKESLLFSLLLLPLTILVKWLLMVFMSVNEPIFDPPALSDIDIIILLYLISCPLQEFIRISAQLFTQKWFKLHGKQAVWWPNIFASLSFGMFHLHISIGFAIGAFILGFLWGWLFTRHKTLIGVTISHIILGGWLLFVLGVNFLK